MWCTIWSLKQQKNTSTQKNNIPRLFDTLVWLTITNNSNVTVVLIKSCTIINKPPFTLIIKNNLQTSGSHIFPFLLDEQYKNINYLWTNISCCEISLATYCSYHPHRTQLSIAASPHPPVMVLSLLQQVLVASEALLLVAHPATATERYTGLNTWLTNLQLFLTSELFVIDSLPHVLPPTWIKKKAELCAKTMTKLMNDHWDVLSRRKQNSHSSQYFKGADIVHKGSLLPVFSCHEVSHVSGDGPRFPSEVRLVVDHNLETKSVILQCHITAVG